MEIQDLLYIRNAEKCHINTATQMQIWVSIRLPAVDMNEIDFVRLVVGRA